MSKIAEQKALEEYPIINPPYNTNIEAVVNAEHAFKREGYIQGYNQAMKDFLEKACEYLRKEFVDMWLRYIRGHSMDDEITMFKNYMQDESEN